MRLWVVMGVLVLLWDGSDSAECAVQITLFMLQSFYFKLQFSRCVSSTARRQLASEYHSEGGSAGEGNDETNGLEDKGKCN